MNINRDYLVTVDVKKSTITNKQSMFFYVLDENTCNIFVQLVFNESNNEIIQKYSAIENAEDYQLEMNIVLADNSCTKLRGHLHNKEEAIFEFEVPNQYVGNYNCELLTSTTINNKKEVITSNKFTYKVKKSVLNDLEEIKDVQGEPILPQLQADMSQLQTDMAQFTEDIELRAEQLEEDMSLKAEKEHIHDEYLTNQNISHLAPIDNPKFTNSISMNRKEGTTIGINSMALGYKTTASGENSFAQGDYTTASGIASHSEGYNTQAIGKNSHAEGFSTQSIGQNSHTEGSGTVAKGDDSHSEGYGTIASSFYQHAQGTFNIEDTKNTYAHIVGNGYNASNRSNAHTLDWDGNAWFAGVVKIGAGNKELATKEYVDSKSQDMTQGNVKLDGYATEDYVDEAIADLVNSAPKSMDTLKELADAIEQHQDIYDAYVDEVSTQLASKADKEHTHSQYLTQHQDLSSYATKIYVTEEIAKAQLDGGDVDLSAYATKTELNNKADKEHTHEEYLTEHQDLSNYALKSELPTDYLTTIPSEYVTEEELEEKGYLTEHQSLEDYAKKEYVDEAIADLPVLIAPVTSMTTTGATVIVNNLTASGTYVLPKRTDGNSWSGLRFQVKTGDGKSLNAMLEGYQHFPFVVNVETQTIYLDNLRITYVIGDTADTSSIKSEPYYLGTKNTKEYTPTEDYHPATKKYVDDNKFSGDYNDLTNKPTIPSIDGLATKEYVDEAVASVQGGDVNLDGYAKTEDIPTKTSQLENDSNFLTSIPSEFITETELNERGFLTEHQDLSEYAKKEQFTTVVNNTLTTDKYQYINITTDTIINLPSVTEFTEIHLYFNTNDDFASAITLSATAQIRYQAELVFEASNGYEIIATYVPNMNWLVGAVKYEGAVSQASGGAVNPPNVVDPL